VRRGRAGDAADDPASGVPVAAVQVQGRADGGQCHVDHRHVQDEHQLRGREQGQCDPGRRAGPDGRPVRGTRPDLPRQWLITTAFSLMHAAAEEAAAGRVTADDAPRLITATLLAAFTPPPESRQP